MDLDALMSLLTEIAPPSDDYITGFDFSKGLREFFSRQDIQDWMIETNQSNLYDKQENVNGRHIGIYSDKTAKHKRKMGRPDHYYTYYETGATYDNLEVVVEDTFVGIYPHHLSAPDYALFLDASAWGLQPDDLNEKRDDIIGVCIDTIRDFITNG